MAEWNPEKDLLAMVTDDSKVVLHRFNWQRLWTISPGSHLLLPHPCSYFCLLHFFFWLTAFSGHTASDETELDISTYFMNYLTAPIMLIFSIQSCWRYTKILLIFQGSASHLFVGAPMVK